MAVPKKRRSKSKSRIKSANWKITLPSMAACKNCGNMVISHQACSVCGHYKGRQVIQIKTKEASQKDS